MTRMKRITISEEMIKEFAPGHHTNNPVVVALKEQTHQDAREIIYHGDEIYIDGHFIKPTIQMIRWMNDFNNGKRVKPCILGYYE